MRDDPFPVEWVGRRAIVAFPGHVDVSNVGRLRDRLLAVINRGATVLIADMTQTVSCDHSTVDAVARAYQRAAINGTQVRLVVTAPAVRRVLSIEGLDRLVPIYPSLQTATAVDDVPAPLPARAEPYGLIPPGHAGPPESTVTPAVLWRVIDALGDGLALTNHGGTIVLVNQRCAELFGYKREELIGMPVDSLVPPDLQAAHHGYRSGYQRTPQTRAMGDRAWLAGLRKDGATFPIRITLSPLPTASEDFVLAVIRDATATRPQTDLADLARSTVGGQPQLGMELLGRVIDGLFQVGLSLQAAAELPGDVLRERLAEALDGLDDVINEIRDYVFASGGEGEQPARLADPAGPGWPVI
jgi:anti-anti-sigma factor